MYLIQLLLPRYDAEGTPFQKAMYDEVRTNLAERFGGVTAYLRSPAVGLWEDADGDCVRDDVLLFEVMVESIDRQHWLDYRRELERRFAQDRILVRATAVECL
jgi:hypothetical protein